MDNSYINWAKHFRHYDFFQNSLSWYRDTIKFHLRAVERKEKILDTGAGSGNLSMELEKHKHSVTAVDSEINALDILKNKSQSIEIFCVSVEKMPFDNESFDAVTSMFLLPFVDDVKSYFSEVNRVLRSGGVFSISAWSPEQSVLELRHLVEEKLTEAGILPEHQKEWEELLITSRQTGAVVSSSKLNSQTLIQLLNNTGFTNIKEHTSAYGKYVIDITCVKL